MFGETPALTKIAPLATPTTTLPPQPISISHDAVLAAIRECRDRLRNSPKQKNKLYAKLIQAFVAGEDLLTADDVKREPALAALRGEQGLGRVAWLLGLSLKPHFTWQSVLDARPPVPTVPWFPGMLERAGKQFVEAQVKSAEKSLKKRAEKVAKKEKHRQLLRG
jgi:hypothetical protein